MTVFSALLLAGVLFVLALVVGIAAGTRLSPRVAQRRQRVAAESTGITVAQMLQRIVALMPMGAAVVDTHRDVVYLNDRARELGLVRDRQLDDQAWQAAQQALAGDDAEFDLQPHKRAAAGRSGISVHGQARLLSEEDRRFAVVFVHDQSDHARMEATRRDFVANVSHELKTPVGAMALLAEALLASADDSETVRRFAEKVLIEANRLGDMVAELIELSRLQGAERLPNVIDVDVDSVVSEAISRHKVAAENANIEVRTDAPSGLRVLGDQTLLVTALGQSGFQCHRLFDPGLTGVDQPPPPRRQHRDRRHRPRYRDRAGRPGAGLRAVLPRRQGAFACHRRQRTGPGDRQTRCRQPQRQHRSVEQAGHRFHVHLVDPGVSRQRWR